MQTFLVLDTNIILLDAYNVINIAKNTVPQPIVVLPETVLDELDTKKTGFSEIAFQARQFARLLAKAERKQIENPTPEYVNITSVVLEGIEIWICSIQSYPSSTESEQSIKNDKKIIFVAELLARKYGNVSFCSNDVMCRLRAEAVGLTAIDHKVVETTDIEFVKVLPVSEEDSGLLHDTPVLVADPNHQFENYNYVFEIESGQKKLATVSNGLLKVIGRTTEEDLRRQDLPPINYGQLFLSKAIQDPYIDIVVCEAKAGSGKTASALSNAIHLVVENKYEGITYVRSSVDDLEKAEEIGFLAGNNEKVEVYIRPLEDTLDLIARKRLKSSKKKGEDFEAEVLEKVTDIKARCRIKGIITLGLRGRTLRNQVVIIDEASNFSKASLQKVLTRIGEGCKVIIIGSNNQIDNPFLNKYTNGLSTVLDACRRPHSKVRMHAVTLPKVVRGPIAEFAENLFTTKV